ncbi:MAG: thioredoxin family protein [Anaerolineales bacterium]|nr:thioredoxin family protein [Anaerolineales bacterium]
MPAHKYLRRKRPARKQPPTLLILVGIALLMIVIFAFRGGGNSSASTASLESQLDQALNAKRPTFVFLHSLDCIPCKEMMGTVANIYPDFQDAVVLIDVDVYDKNNANILRRERLQSIPTLVFYDAQGIRQVFIGAMPSDQFRDTLTRLAAGQ